MKKVLFCVLVFGFTVSVFSQNIDDFGYVENNGQITITKYIGRKRAVIIPSKIYQFPVSRIGQGAFWSMGLTSVTIPDSVTSIGAEAFSENRLTSVTIPDSVTRIENFAFSENRLTNITIGSNVLIIKEFEGRAFDNAFDDFYNAQGKKAGTYTLSKGKWSVKYR